MYQIRVGLRVSPKVPVQIEAMVGESKANTQNGTSGRGNQGASLIGGCGASKAFQIMYRNEEVTLQDIIQFRAHLLGRIYQMKFTRIEQ